MKKNSLIVLIALCLSVVLSGCMFKRERASDVLAKMEIVEVDHLGYVRYRGAVITPAEFTKRIRARKDEVAGKPVLLSVNPEVYTNQPAIVPYLRRILGEVKTGEIYDKVPRSL